MLDLDIESIEPFLEGVRVIALGMVVVSLDPEPCAVRELLVPPGHEIAAREVTGEGQTADIAFVDVRKQGKLLADAAPVGTKAGLRVLEAVADARAVGALGFLEVEALGIDA